MTTTLARMDRKSKNGSVLGRAGVRRTALTDVYEYQHGILSRDIGEGQLALLNMDISSRYFQLDLWMARLWKMIDGNRTVSELIAQLGRESKFPETRLRKEVLNALESFSEMNLIHRKTAESTGKP